MTANSSIDISLVSHGHGPLVVQALESLAASLSGTRINVRVLLTLNVPEPHLEQMVHNKTWPFNLQLIQNSLPLGFGANHNQAFRHCTAPWFAVVNPDVFWPKEDASFWNALTLDPWPARVGVVCPDQYDANGHRQDFTRVLMTPLALFVRELRRRLGAAPSSVVATVEHADWVNGACMFFRAQTFAALKGFDERYFMYCEDADICLRLQLAGWSMQGADWAVVHDARRNTGRSWRHLGWHLRSLLRLWTSSAFWRFVIRAR